MKPIDGWDEVTPEVAGNGEQLPVGGYVCQILGAEEAVSRKGNDMLKVAFDIADGEYAGFYGRKFENKRKFDANAKWPGMYYCPTRGERVGRFKGFIKTIENCNEGYAWDWNEASLKGKLFGGVFGEEEFLTDDNKLMTTVKLRFVLPVEGIEDAPAPKLKQLSAADRAKLDGGGDSGNAFSDLDCPF